MHQQLQGKIKQDQSVRNKTEEISHEQVQQKRHEEQVKRQNDVRNMAKQMAQENLLLSQEKKARKQQEKFESIQTDLVHLQKDPFKVGMNAL